VLGFLSAHDFGVSACTGTSLKESFGCVNVLSKQDAKTAVKSEPPLPRMVSSPSAVTPRKPARHTILLSSKGSIRV